MNIEQFLQNPPAFEDLKEQHIHSQKLNSFIDEIIKAYEVAKKEQKQENTFEAELQRRDDILMQKFDQITEMLRIAIQRVNELEGENRQLMEKVQILMQQQDKQE